MSDEQIEAIRRALNRAFDADAARRTEIVRGQIDLIAEALREDRASDDVTSKLLVPADARGRAVIRAKEPGVVAGVGGRASRRERARARR